MSDPATRRIKGFDAQKLTEILREGTAGISCEYYRLNIAGAEPVYRERVYCYELYHQMRCLWPPRCPFLLNGEVDKAAHPILRAIRTKPDLLVHGPGDMGLNHAIIEVKSADAHRRLAGISKDIATLLRFRRQVGYERAILLVYGEETDGLVATARAAYTRQGGDCDIEVWLHLAPRQPALQVELLQPRQ